MAGDRDYRARLELFSDKSDLAKAERLFRQAVNLEPSSFFDFIELGDIYLERELAIKPWKLSRLRVTALPLDPSSAGRLKMSFAC